MFATLLISQLLKLGADAFAGAAKAALDLKHAGQMLPVTPGTVIQHQFLVLTPEEAKALEADPTFLRAKVRAEVLLRHSDEAKKMAPPEFIGTSVVLAMTPEEQLALVNNMTYLNARQRAMSGGPGVADGRA